MRVGFGSSNLSMSQKTRIHLKFVRCSNKQLAKNGLAYDFNPVFDYWKITL